jgi:hypothetical protein
MEKNRKFERDYDFDNKKFNMRIVMDPITGMSDVWMCEIDSTPFVYSTTATNVHKDDLFGVISKMEDGAQEYAIKPDLDLVMETIIEKGFHEIVETLATFMDDEPEG